MTSMNIRMWREVVRRFVRTAVVAGCGIHLTTTYIGNVTVSKGPSMMPTINANGDLLLTEAISPRLGKLQRGDVVVAKSMTKPGTLICKRILGMDGDRVCVNPTSHPKKYRTVPRGRVWLQGDNLSNSTDSRTYGFVPLALVTSRVVARVWPPTQVSLIERELPQFLPAPDQRSEEEGDTGTRDSDMHTAQPAADAGGRETVSPPRRQRTGCDEDAKWVEQKQAEQAAGDPSIQDALAGHAPSAPVHTELLVQDDRRQRA